ncbi:MULTISPECIES: ABC transporter ATP-binding protein [Streptococcus]|jgi:putative bacteriocin ABC transporter|uniref:Peptide ABC transporter ATP-binding protein n=3 Tax=Streptococcus TaxID=1301 RepID=A0A1X1G9E8_STROR|nr:MULTISPECIES: ABC transporter ATP-binding protein [Streptococcus]MCY7103265.1 ABC transporter ATP-binding protein [Streptococcus oralis]NMD83279.1 ABC transporter ATP-binding protein [Streptococcus sp. WB01_FAA12]ORO43445.1 peptide ABC transporter ATP-binding protein [Streptococcus oralis subsp. tigurinus]ORO46838.1 peptide ABC transporter ATP-binding protein [Streptococcus oralis subsp. tigurinus]RSI79532.1 ABC transporter ATP-binding protein YxdL [Streptococcus mitis]
MIELQHIWKQFGSRIIFSDLNLNFQSGMVYALIGDSGCGKTTLLNMLAKLETFDKGEIVYKGKSLTSLKNEEFYRNELGYLFQNFGLLESQTIRENLELGLIGKKQNKKQEKERLLLQALQAVRLDYLSLNQKIYELSGGEAQRVALAKIILKDPPLILADEPTASLDPKNSKEIMEILLELRNANRTIIIATHNPSIWKMADQVIHLSQDGKEYT